jgi:hypothetical protein
MLTHMPCSGSAREARRAPDVGEENATDCGHVGAPKVTDSDTGISMPRC